MKKSMVLLAGIPFLVAAALGLVLAQRSSPATSVQMKPQQFPAANPTLKPDFGKVPLLFVPNQGQTDGRVNFYIQATDKTIYFTPDGVTFSLNYGSKPGPGQRNRRLFKALFDSGEGLMDKNQKRWIVKMNFVGANEDVKPEALDQARTVISFFKGKQDEWKAGLQAYSRIIYRNLWPGIDLIYKGDVDKLKSEFIVHPGADPAQIRLACQGADDVRIDGAGRLVVSTQAGGFEEEAPIAYQVPGGIQTRIRTSFRMFDKKESLGNEGLSKYSAQDLRYCYSFRPDNYDRNLDLVIDPATIVFCGFIGGISGDMGQEIAVDSSNNVYIVGNVQSETLFPAVPGPDSSYNGGLMDAFVAKVDSTGTTLVYCGYIGGSDRDVGMDIAVDASGNAYITGGTYSSDFPVKTGPGLSYRSRADCGLCAGDVFVAKINASGTALVYSGYIGGSDSDGASGIAVDQFGNAYVAGVTKSSDIHVFNSWEILKYKGGADGFVAKIAPDGASYAYFACIGSPDLDGCTDVAVDSAGNAYVAGGTLGWISPLREGPSLSRSKADRGEGFVAKINPAGDDVVYCGFIGGISDVEVDYIAIDRSGGAYIAGLVVDWEGRGGDLFPATVGPDLSYNGGQTDIFVAKVSPSGRSLDYCGFIGGSNSDIPGGIAVDGQGFAYVAGYTSSDEATFPVAAGPDLTFNGLSDAFVAKIDKSGDRLLYCGYIGGVYGDNARGVAVDSTGNAYVTGETSGEGESGFPTAVGPSLSNYGGADAFVAKVRFFADSDGDAIEDIIDTSPNEYSDNFSDASLSPAGVTYGYLITRGDQELEISEVPNPNGVWFKATAARGVNPAIVRCCAKDIKYISIYTPNDFGVTCKCALITVNKGPVEIHLVTDSIITVPDSTTAEITELTEDSILVKNSAGTGTIAVLDKGKETLLNPGASIVVTQNTPPVADAGISQPSVTAGVDCKAFAFLDGSGSFDAEGDSLTYLWTWNGGSATEAKPSIQLPRGTTTVALVVNDGKAVSLPAYVDITVVDKTPPTIHLSDPVSYKDATGLKANKLTVTATDNCATPVIPTITKVEVYNSKGILVRGATVYSVSGNDIYIYSNDGFSVKVTATATDQSGNPATAVLRKNLIKFRG